jgi:deazaflavin-dependent oxidoreductase (nitroreductase family)
MTDRRRGTIRLAVVGLLVATVASYAAYLRSPAHSQGNRLFYRDRRPNRLGRAFGGLWSRMSALGLGPSFLVSLETVGRRSGVPHAIPVVLADHAGNRYVVSMLGERSPWVHNVRAAEGRAVIRHGRPQEVRLVELPPEERAPVIKAFLGRAMDARPHIPVAHDAPLEAFEAIAADYPVFRIEPAVA